MIRRRARDAGIKAAIGNHTIRGTGITNFLENGGKLEDGRSLIRQDHEAVYRREQAIHRGEVEKILALG